MLIFMLGILTNPSEKRGLCLLKLFSKMFHNLPNFLNKKTQNLLVLFFILMNYEFTIHNCNFAENVKTKKTISMYVFEFFHLNNIAKRV